MDGSVNRSFGGMTIVGSPLPSQRQRVGRRRLEAGADVRSHGEIHDFGVGQRALHVGLELPAFGSGSTPDAARRPGSAGASVVARRTREPGVIDLAGHEVAV